MQKMETVAEYIEKNLQDIKRLVNAGIIQPSLLSHYNIYLTMNEIKHKEKRMKAYEIVGRKNNVSEKTVIRAIKTMEEKM